MNLKQKIFDTDSVFQNLINIIKSDRSIEIYLSNNYDCNCIQIINRFTVILL